MARWNLGIHDSGGAGSNALHLDTATALRADLGRHVSQQGLQALDHGRIIVANLEQHFGMSRDDARRTGVEGNAAGGPYRTWTAQRGKPVIDGDAKPGQRQAGIPAIGHPGRPGVILLAD